MPSLRSLVVRRANTPQIEMGAATSSVTSITTMKNIQTNDHRDNHNNHNNHNNDNENDLNDKKKGIKVIADNNKVDKFSGIRSPLLRNRSNNEETPINEKKNLMKKKKNSNAPLLRPESCASLETHGDSSWVSLAPGALRKCETAVGLSTLALEGRAINRSRVCSRCSSLLSLASSSRYSLAAGGNFVPANPTINDDDDDGGGSDNDVIVNHNYSSSKSIHNGKFKCKLCLGEVSVGLTTSIESCGCSYCKDCMQQYAEFEINEGAYEMSCPDAQCERAGIISLKEIKDLVSQELMEKHHRFRLNRDVSVDKGRAWCPSPGCETVCSIGNNQEVGSGSILLGPVHCPSCSTEFCSLCREPWHSGKCPEIPSGIPIDNDRIKCCPMCSVPIEKDEGCAQMMCKRCKHVFCWYCLASLDDDFLLRHYDKGPCKNKLGHSRASVIWHRTQVIGIFAGFGLLLLVASPLLLLAAPCIVCCKCRVCGSSRLEQEEGLPDDTGT